MLLIVGKVKFSKFWSVVKKYGLERSNITMDLAGRSVEIPMQHTMTIYSQLNLPLTTREKQQKSVLRVLLIPLKLTNLGVSETSKSYMITPLKETAQKYPHYQFSVNLRTYSTIRLYLNTKIMMNSPLTLQEPILPLLLFSIVVVIRP
jgi:hypothetical protein